MLIPGDSLVQCAVCGDQSAINAVLQPTTAHKYLLPTAGMGCVSLVQALLAVGVDVNTIGVRGATALTEAAWGGHPLVVTLLLQQGAWTWQQNEQGRRAVHWAALQGHAACLELLLDHLRPSPDVETMPSSRGMLSSASASASVSTLASSPSLQVSASSSSSLTRISSSPSPSPATADATYASNINSSDEKELTPLMLASRNGHASCVHTLIDRGCEMNLRSAYGRSAVGFAAKYGHLQCVRLLLKAGADVTLCDTRGVGKGFTPLDHARSREHAECVALLTTA